MIFLIFLAMAVLKSGFVAVMKLVQKEYIKNINDSVFYIVFISFFQTIFLFLIPPYYSYQVEYDMLIYPAAFAIFYIVAYIFMLNAFKFGPTSLTSVIQNFSMFVPITIGMFLWNEKINVYQTSGLILFGLIMFLFNNSSYKINGQKEKLTLRWLMITLFSTLFMGMAIFTSKQYALEYTESPKEYLILFNVIIVLFGTVYFIYQIFKKNYKIILNKKYIIYTIISGFLLAATNIMFMQYVTKFDSAYFFPLLSIAGIIGVVAMGRVFLKERISKKAYWGVALSIVVIFLISIGK